MTIIDKRLLDDVYKEARRVESVIGLLVRVDAYKADMAMSPKELYRPTKVDSIKINNIVECLQAVSNALQLLEVAISDRGISDNSLWGDSTIALLVSANEVYAGMRVLEVMEKYNGNP